MRNFRNLKRLLKKVLQLIAIRQNKCTFVAKMKRLTLILCLALTAIAINAAGPNGSGTYYKNADGKKGAALKTALCAIIYNRTELTYNDLWTAYKTTDVRADGYIWDMYSNATSYEPGGTAQGANFSREGDSYNREHSFPKSWFGGQNNTMPMYTDLHHLYPVDGYINNRRNNYPFGETNGEKYKSANNFSKLGACTYPGYTGTVFEPADEYKGDFARTYFYMVTCYEEKLADWVTNFAATEVEDVLDGQAYPGLTTWQLNMLLEWARQDPVSEKEVNRNNAVYGIQRNRNPFIDYPGLEEYIWGTKTNEAFSYDDEGAMGDTEVAASFSYAAIPDGYAADGTSGTFTVSGSVSFTVAYAGINTKSANGSVYGYAMFLQNKGFLYNTTAPEGYYPSKVVVTFSNTTGESGKAGITFGTAVLDSRNSSVTGTVAKSGTLELSNTDESKVYWNFSTTGANVQVDKVEITYTPKTPELLAPQTYASAVTIPYGESFTLQAGTHYVTDGAVTLVSMNPAVATVEGNTVKAVAVGTTTINVTYGAGTRYDAATSSFTLTVTAPEGQTEAPAVTTEPQALFAESFGSNGGSARAWNNDYSVKNGSSAVYGDAIYTVAEAKQSKNTMGQAGSALVSSQGKTGSFTVGPLHVAAYSSLTVSHYFGMSSSSWAEGSYVRLSYSTDGNTYATVARTNTAVPSKAVSANANLVQATYALPESAQSNSLYLKLEFYVSQTNIKGEEIGQAYLDEVCLTGSTSGASLASVQLNANGYATYCSPYPLDFSQTADYSAWVITGINGNKITFEQLKGSVKGGTGMLLKGEANAEVELQSAASSTVPDNLLVGTLAPTFVEADSYYGLSGNQFVHVLEGTVSANKALLPVSAVQGSAVKAFTFQFKGTPLGIEAVQPERQASDQGRPDIYDLGGQRLSKLQKGINILSGKKVVVR